MRKKQGKRIVGVYAHGANDCDVPEALEKYADDVRGWQSDGIVDAILGKTNEWREPSGTPRPASDQALWLRSVKLHSYVVARDYGFAPNPFFRRLHSRDLQTEESAGLLRSGTGSWEPARRRVSVRKTSSTPCV